MKKNLLVAQSGGPTAVIIASLAGSLRELRDQSLNEKTIMQYATGVEE